jgi:pSer/pThr/pTyr-binding forkhead associated (FHA) protein
MAAPTMKAEIRARLRKGRPSRFDVKADGSVLGRDDAAAVPIPLDGVSREHARIKWDGKGWWLEDLKSTNGTFVNGEKVLREKLQHLDVISLGRKADVVFLLRSMDAQAPATRPGVVRAALVDAEDGTVYEIAVGEFTLGRSSACNLVANENAVSKVHARIERAADQVVLEDLSSSNGTFVNGSRVRTAILRDTDTLELANVAKFRVVIELGEVGATGLYRAPTLSKKEDQPKFSGDWKTPTNGIRPLCERRERDRLTLHIQPAADRQRPQSPHQTCRGRAPSRAARARYTLIASRRCWRKGQKTVHPDTDPSRSCTMCRAPSPADCSRDARRLTPSARDTRTPVDHSAPAADHVRRYTR